MPVELWLRRVFGIRVLSGFKYIHRDGPRAAASTQGGGGGGAVQRDSAGQINVLNAD